jgi:hypothetical protein
MPPKIDKDENVEKNTCEVDNMTCAVEYKMPQSLNLDDLGNCWPQWQRFKQSFRIFVLAAGFEKLTETRKAAILLNCIGQQAQELYFNVLQSEDKTKLEEIITLFDEHFKPKQNEVINSYNFNKRNQEDGETFDAFYTAIRKIAENCNYIEKDRMLRDRIVIGVKDQRTQQKLLEIKELTLEKAVDVCRSAELSKEHMKTLNSSEVHAVQARTPSHPPADAKAKYSDTKNRFSHNNHNVCQYNRNYYMCRKCKTEHGPRNCPAYGKVCTKCNKYNHFSVGCSMPRKQVHEVQEYECNNNVHDL